MPIAARPVPLRCRGEPGFFAWCGSYLYSPRFAESRRIFTSVESRRMPLLRHRATRARGAATIVEFAVVAPIFFVLVLGLVEAGRAFMVNELLTEAARQG